MGVTAPPSSRKRPQRLAPDVARMGDVEEASEHRLLVGRLHHGDHVILPLSPVQPVDLEAAALVVGARLISPLDGPVDVFGPLIGELVQHHEGRHAPTPFAAEGGGALSPATRTTIAGVVLRERTLWPTAKKRLRPL